MGRLSVNLAGTSFKNPVIMASGTFGFGRDYEALYPLSALGGISTKGMTLHPRAGNPPPRIAETPAGMLNAVGLQNPGLAHFIEVELPYLTKQDTVVIANVAGGTVDECATIAACLDQTALDWIELNISCPNVKQGGVAFGTSCQAAAEITRAMRQATSKPLMVKLSPNVTDITSIAKAVEAEGADAISLINTLLGMRIDLSTRRPVLYNNVGGLSGPAVFPIAVRMVYQVARAVSIPVVGMGGIASASDAIEMMMAGATAVQVGSVIFSDPMAPMQILAGIEQFLIEHRIDQVSELIGTVRPY